MRWATWVSIAAVGLSFGVGCTSDDAARAGDPVRPDARATTDAPGDAVAWPDIPDPPDGLKVPQPDSQFGPDNCVQVLACIRACSGNKTCETVCGTRASVAALLFTQALGKCLNPAQRGTCKADCAAATGSVDKCWACLERACVREFAECRKSSNAADGKLVVPRDAGALGEGVTTDIGTKLKCSGIVACILACGSNRTCTNACGRRAVSATEAILAQAVFNCYTPATKGTCKTACATSRTACLACIDRVCKKEVDLCNK